jgi:hypothetical protein
MCELVPPAECKYIRGRSSIFLDEDAFHAEAIAYEVIQYVLADTNLLSELTGSNLLYSQFDRPIGENLVILSTSDGENLGPAESNGKARIGIAAALVSFAVTAIFLCGMYRKQSVEMDSSRRFVKGRMAHMHARRRQFFENLPDEHGLEPGWMTTNTNVETPLTPPSVTWSVSDMTSDSQSIRSSLPMDRIDEEGPVDDEASAKSGVASSSPGKSERDFISHWNAKVDSTELASFGDTTPFNALHQGKPWDNESITPVHSNRIEDYDAIPLQGCQFLVDVSLDESSDLNCSSDREGVDDKEVPSFSPLGAGSYLRSSSYKEDEVLLFSSNDEDSDLDCSSDEEDTIESPFTPPATPPKPTRVSTLDSDDWTDFYTPVGKVDTEILEPRALELEVSQLSQVAGPNFTETKVAVVVEVAESEAVLHYESIDLAMMMWWAKLLMSLARGRQEARLTNG